MLTSSTLPFDKLSCGGNDFIIIDCTASAPPADAATLARSLCHRNMGVGADGMILLLSHPEFPFRMQLFNADGSPAEVSYNGCRCIGRYAVDKGLAAAAFSFDSDAGVVAASVSNDVVSISVPDTRLVAQHVEIESLWGRLDAFATMAGVPWLVIPLDESEHSALSTWAMEQRRNGLFEQGNNVAVVHGYNDHCIQARFFERGVDMETMSSGSGSVAAAHYCADRHGADGSVTIQCSGGAFPVEFHRTATEITQVKAAAAVISICSGNYRLQA